MSWLNLSWPTIGSALLDIDMTLYIMNACSLTLCWIWLKMMGIHCLICHLIIFIWNKSNFYILTESMIWIKHIENKFYAKWNVYMFWAHLCTKEDFIFTRMFFASLIEAIKFIILWHLFVAPVVCLPLFVSVLPTVQ